jgi:AcrR family transcriptional regulator
MPSDASADATRDDRRAATRHGAEASLSAPGALPPLEARIRAATLACVGRWGVSKTTLDDIARTAGCSRATIYRTFPGGKDTVLLATFAGETASFFADLAVAIDATDSLEDLLVVALSMACREITTDPVISYLCAHEPEAIMPFVSFEGLDPLLDWARGFAVPHLERFVDADTASTLGEWMARVVLSYSFERELELPVDLADEAAARRFVRTYVLPGLHALGAPAPDIDLTDRPTTEAAPSTVPTT